jgi:hypothetical protein
MPARRQLIAFQHDIAGGGSPNRDVSSIQDKFAYLNTWAILGSTVGRGQAMNNQATPWTGRDGSVGMNPISRRRSRLDIRLWNLRRELRPLEYRCSSGDSGGDRRGG